MSLSLHKAGVPVAALGCVHYVSVDTRQVPSSRQWSGPDTTEPGRPALLRTLRQLDCTVAETQTMIQVVVYRPISIYVDINPQIKWTYLITSMDLRWYKTHLVQMDTMSIINFIQNNYVCWQLYNNVLQMCCGHDGLIVRSNHGHWKSLLCIGKCICHQRWKMY